MEIKTIWNVTNANHRPDGLITHVSYVVTSTCDDCSVSTYGGVSLKDPSTETFIPYELVTEELLIDWAQSTLGEDRVNDIHKIHMERMSTKINEQEEQTGLPWN